MRILGPWLPPRPGPGAEASQPLPLSVPRPAKLKEQLVNTVVLVASPPIAKALFGQEEGRNILILIS